MTETKVPTRKMGLNWKSLVWVAGMHLGLLLAPFTFTWSGLVVFGILYVITGLGITLCYHRLLTHRSFATSKFVEYILTLFGVLANEGGPLKWVATHRKHHRYADQDGDPHSPMKGFWWAQVGWWVHLDPVLDDPVLGRQNVKDLARDPVHQFYEKWQILPPILLAAVLFVSGEWWWGGAGLSWVVWGMFVRTVFVFHASWLVNSAAHIWGYRNFETRDRSTNLWWVAALTFGEGWHNNHHAHQRSARHGMRWWELDPTYVCVRLMGVVGLAWDIHPAPNRAVVRRSKGKPSSNLADLVVSAAAGNCPDRSVSID